MTMDRFQVDPINSDITKPWHFGQQHQSKQFDFMPSDTEEIFLKNLQIPEHRNYFQQQGWLEKGCISYDLNSEGFRSDEFDRAADSLVALGCSYTMGLGLPWKDLWPTLVGRALDLSVYNLAWGGFSADTCYRLAEYWIPELRPKLVVVLTPPVDRFELHMALGEVPVENYLPQSQAESAPRMKNWLTEYWTNPINGTINRRKNQLAIRAICQQFDIKCLIYNCETWMSRSRLDVGYARDLMHGGPPAHKWIAETVINDYASIK